MDSTSQLTPDLQAALETLWEIVVYPRPTRQVSREGQRAFQIIREALDKTAKERDHYRWHFDQEQARAERAEARLAELERVVEAAEGLRHSPGADCWCPYRVVDQPDLPHTEECEAMRLAIAALDGKE